ncbi:MAG: AraC family transcriptional regulator [Pseudomonadota bacterium]
MGSETSLETHPEIEGLTLFSAPPGPHEHAVHAHDAYSVIVLYDGAKDFHHQGKTISVAALQIAVANPGELHGCGPVNGQPWAHKTWYLSRQLMGELASERGLGSDVLLKAPLIDDPAMARQLNAAHDKSRTGELLDRQSAAIQALTALIDRHAVSIAAVPPQAAPGEPARDRVPVYEALLREHLDRVVDLATLAQACHVGRNQVIRDFRAVHGVTPGEYFRQLRLDHAKHLMGLGTELSTVSQMTGFSDQSHFTRTFRRSFGVTPGEYRRLLDGSPGTPPF